MTVDNSHTVLNMGGTITRVATGTLNILDIGDEYKKYNKT